MCQMYEGEFEGLLNNIFPEETFKNQIFDMIYERDDYTISDYASHHFGNLVGETCTCLTFHARKNKL